MTERIKIQFDHWYMNIYLSRIVDLSKEMKYFHSLPEDFQWGVKEVFFDQFDLTLRVEKGLVQMGLHKGERKFFGKVGAELFRVGSTPAFCSRKEVREAVEAKACLCLERLLDQGYVKSLLK